MTSGSNPFDWLSGGLFFGKKSTTTTSNSNSSSSGNNSLLESIENSKDVLSLIRGIQENLTAILADPHKTYRSNTGSSSGSSSGSGTTSNDAVGSSGDTTAANTNSTTTANNTTSTESASHNNTNNTSSSGKEAKKSPSPYKLIAARLSRLRYLLYDERRISSSSSLSSSLSHHSAHLDLRVARAYAAGGSTIPPAAPAPPVAGNTLQGLTSHSNSPQQQELIPLLLENLQYLPFESRKHVAAIFNYLLVCGLEGSDAEQYRIVMEAFRDYVLLHFDRIMTTIVQGHDTSRYGGASDIGLHFGSMYRCCLRHAALYRQALGTTESAAKYVFPFLDTYVHLPNFDVSSDAMESLRLVFTATATSSSSSSSSTGGGGTGAGESRTASMMSLQEESQRILMAEMAAEFLTRDYEEVWDKRFNPKLLSDTANYMTRRVALQILATVLLTRSNYNVMIQYVASRSNLILVMHLLRDTSPHITLDAFHVFKVFVANPNKPEEVSKILRDNKFKLCRYLATLHQDREESDSQFRDEKALIIATIDAL